MPSRCPRLGYTDWAQKEAQRAGRSLGVHLRAPLQISTWFLTIPLQDGGLRGPKCQDSFLLCCLPQLRGRLRGTGLRLGCMSHSNGKRQVPSSLYSRGLQPSVWGEKTTDMACYPESCFLFYHRVWRPKPTRTLFAIPAINPGKHTYCLEGLFSNPTPTPCPPIGLSSS